MANTRQTRATRSRAVDSGHSTAELKSLDTPTKSPRTKKGLNKTQANAKIYNATHKTASTGAAGSNDVSEEDVGAADVDNEEDDSENDQLSREAALAPSRKSSVIKDDLSSDEQSPKVSWAGLKRGVKTIEDDQASISDLDMHGSVSSGSDEEEVNDDDDSDAGDSVNDVADDEIEVADDDDDYGDVDNVSDSSDHSDQFERDVEAAWQHDDIDWDDDYVYQYNENRSGFLYDEQFLQENLDHIGDTDWAIQFIDFSERVPNASRQVRSDEPLSESPLVRRVDSMTMNEGSQNTDNADSSETSTQGTEHSVDESRIDDEGDDTEEDLPDESQLSTPATRQRPAAARPSTSNSSSSMTTPTPSRKPVWCKIPLDPTKATVRSIMTPSGKFIRRFTIPRSSGPEWITVPSRRRRQVRSSNSSPISRTSSMSDFGDQDITLINAINGRLFQQAHFGQFYRNSRLAPMQTPARNSFLSGPALHDFDPEVAVDMDSASDNPLSVLPDLAQLIDYEAGIVARDFYPHSGRLRAQSADALMPGLDFDIGTLPGPAQSAEVPDPLETFTSLPPITPTTEVVMMDLQSSPPARSTKSTPSSAQRKRRSSNDSDVLMESPSFKRNRVHA